MRRVSTRVGVAVLAACLMAGCDSPGAPAEALPVASASVAVPVSATPSVSPSVTPSMAPVKPVITEAGLSYFYSIALGAEYGATERIVARWDQPVVTVRLHGTVDSRSRTCLNKVIKDFNALTATTDLRLTKEEADVEFHFAPKSKFPALLKSYVRGNDGYVSTSRNGRGAIVSATVLIRSSGIGDRTRCHLIREELTQGMGLLRDSGKYWDSIFQIDYAAKPTRYSTLDKEVIRLLYSGALRPGDDKKAIRAAVTTK